MRLSILICSLTARKPLLERLMLVLGPQVTSDVEVLFYTDNGESPIGTKRQALLHRAKGDYIVYIDDDDVVSHRYIELILLALKSNPDCVGFAGESIRAGVTNYFECRIEAHEWLTNGIMYYRPIGHLNPVRREIALKSGFPDIDYFEDRYYSDQLRKYLKTSEFIQEKLYFYECADPYKISSAQSELARGGLGLEFCGYYENYIVVGVASSSQKTLRWITTLRNSGYTGKVILHQTDSAYFSVPVELNVDIRRHSVDKNIWENNAGNLCNQWKFIAETCKEFPNAYILRTDVWDVVFQEDPRKFLQINAGRSLRVSYEIDSNLTCDNNLGWYLYSNKVRNNSKVKVLLNAKMINSGLIAGSSTLMLDVCNRIISRKYETWNDQSELNCIAYFDEDLIFEDAHPFLCSLYGHQNILLKDGQVYLSDKRLLGVIHGNGPAKQIIETCYPV